jgi:hypothetical protein
MPSPSLEHAILVDVFRSNPGFALDRLRALGVGGEAALSATPRVVESTFPVTSPDYHVDLAIACGDLSGCPELLVLIEVQLEKDLNKLWTWPLYQAAAGARFKCESCVVVVTLDENVEAWAAAPIVQGPSGSVFRAVVLGPTALRPPEGEVQSPELALLAALCHGNHEPKRIGVALAALEKLEDERAKAYFDLLKYYRNKALERALLEAFMATGEQKYLSDFARKYYGEGEAKGMAEGEAKGLREAVVTVAAARGIALSDEDRGRIAACSDLAALEAWLTRAAHADTARDVFEPGHV